MQKIVPHFSRLKPRLQKLLAPTKLPALSKSRTKLRIAHFFGDHDPFNFWTDQDMSRLPLLLEQMREDGFNAIILVIPRFPFLNESASQGVDAWYTRRLEQVFTAADAIGLKIILRINYPHTSIPGTISDSANRVFGLFKEREKLTGFQKYCVALASIAKGHSSFLDAFLCWEDIWYIFNLNEYDTDVRRQWALDLGLEAFVESASKKRQDKNRARYSDTTWRGEIIPAPNTFENELWIACFERLLFDTLGDIARNAFGTANFEVRADRYPVKVGDQYEWIDFSTRAEQSDDRRYAYWAPYYGSRNDGERLGSADAVSRLRYLLDHLKAGSSSSIVIEQFNFVDNTLAYSRNAQIAPNEVEKFLGDAAHILKDFTGGYGVWAYRDYRENLLYNGTFQRGLENWSAHNDDIVANANGVTLHAGHRLSKVLSPATRAQSPYALYGDFTFELDLTALAGDMDTCVSVWVNDTEVGLLSSGANNTLTIPKSLVNWDKTTIEIRAIADVRISRVAFYGYVQHGGIYDRFGKPGQYLAAIRSLNSALSG
jgi:hypothetical protein